MSLETRIFEGTWAEAIRHSEAIPSNQLVLIYAANPVAETPETAIAPSLDPENDASIALLDSWIAKVPKDAESIREAEEDLQDFMYNINTERKRAGASLVYS